jgi:hypothetical protein
MILFFYLIFIKLNKKQKNDKNLIIFSKIYLLNLIKKFIYSNIFY